MPQSAIICAIALVGAGLTALGVLAVRRLGEYRRVQRHSRPDEEWSLDRYQPMARLLAGEDADFLRRNIHCPKVAACWDRSQRRIVRLYLKELAVDFGRLHTKARVLVAESPEQYAALMPLLLRQQFTFRRTLVMMELRLAVGGLGITQSSVGELVGTIEAIQRELSRVAAMNAA
jgi:hypothetical protein